ncbi:MAG: MFS transporter [Kineosporiaceae bacterium]|nr:MFS transporter [Aeromicrobium sp.]
MSAGLARQDDGTKQLYAKVSRRLVPFLFVCYAAAYLDRVNVGFAKLQMESDLGFSDTVYGLGAGLFFVGYIIFEVPSNVVLHKVGAKWWIARIMISWAIISAAMSLVQSPAAFYALRFLLGVAEAGFIPGILFYLTLWYPSARRGRVFAYFLAAIPVASMVGGPLSGWIMESFAGVGGLSGWRWLFLIEAVPSLVLGFVVLAYLDNNVNSAKWLTVAEKIAINDAVTADLNSKPQMHSRVTAVFRDPKIWLLSGIYFCVALGLYIVSFWLPTIIAATGVKSTLHIGLLTAIPYSVAVIAMIANNVHADRTGERRWHAVVPCLITAAGLVITGIGAHNTVVAMIGLVIAAAGASTTQAAFWTLPSAFLGGTGAAAGIAFINSLGNISGLVSTSLVGWLSDLTGSTTSSLYSFAVVLVIGGLLITTLPSSLVDDPKRLPKAPRKEQDLKVAQP